MHQFVSFCVNLCWYVFIDAKKTQNESTLLKHNARCIPGILHWFQIVILSSYYFWMYYYLWWVNTHTDMIHSSLLFFVCLSPHRRFWVFVSFWEVASLFMWMINSFILMHQLRMLNAQMCWNTHLWFWIIFRIVFISAMSLRLTKNMPRQWVSTDLLTN